MSFAIHPQWEKLIRAEETETEHEPESETEETEAAKISRHRSAQYKAARFYCRVHTGMHPARSVDGDTLTLTCGCIRNIATPQPVNGHDAGYGTIQTIHHIVKRKKKAAI